MPTWMIISTIDQYTTYKTRYDDVDAALDAWRVLKERRQKFHAGRIHDTLAMIISEAEYPPCRE